MGVLYVDLDHFKEVNDIHGHGVGDEVLTESARRMRSVLRTNDVLARLGGDEFSVLCRGLHRADELTVVAERLLAVFREPMEVGSTSVAVGASIGIAVAPASATASDSDALLKRADKAMYEAKAAGRNQWMIARTA